MYLALQVQVGTAVQIDPEFSGSPQALTWAVNGIVGGNPVVGTVVPISTAVGAPVLYTAPATPPARPVKITAKNALGNVLGTTAIVVVSVAPPLPPVGTFAATPSTISPGGSAMLVWTSQNATGASVDQGVGIVSPAAGGSVSVSPSATTMYTLTLTGAGGTVTYKVIVTVSIAAAITAVDSTTGNLLVHGVPTLIFAIEEAPGDYVGSVGTPLSAWKARMQMRQPALQLWRYGRDGTISAPQGYTGPNLFDLPAWDNTKEQEENVAAILGGLWSGNAGGPSTPPDPDKSYPAQAPYTNAQVLANIKAYIALRQTRLNRVMYGFSGEVPEITVGGITSGWYGYNSGVDYRAVMAAIAAQDPSRVLNDDMTVAEASVATAVYKAWLAQPNPPIICGEFVIGTPTPIGGPANTGIIRPCIDTVGALRAYFANLDAAWNAGARFVYGISLTPNQELNSLQNPYSPTSPNGNSTAIPIPPTRMAVRRIYSVAAMLNCRYFSELDASGVQRDPWVNAPDEPTPGWDDAGYPTLEAISGLVGSWLPTISQQAGGSLPDGAMVYVRVAAMNGTTIVALSAEAYLQLAPGSGQSVLVNWTPYTGGAITGYRVYHSALTSSSTGGPYGDAGSENQYVSIAAGTTVVLTGVGATAGMIPWFKRLACGQNGVVTDPALTPLLDNGRIPSLVDLRGYVAEIQNDIYSQRAMILAGARFAPLSASPGLLAAMKMVGGTRYVIAVNVNTPEQHAGASDFAETALAGATIAVGGGTTVARLFEPSNPAPGFAGGTITDNFRPMEAHWYTVV